MVPTTRATLRFHLLARLVRGSEIRGYGEPTIDSSSLTVQSTLKNSVPLFHDTGCSNVPTAGFSALYIMRLPA